MKKLAIVWGFVLSSMAIWAAMNQCTRNYEDEVYKTVSDPNGNIDEWTNDTIFIHLGDLEIRPETE